MFRLQCGCTHGTPSTTVAVGCASIPYAPIPPSLLKCRRNLTRPGKRSFVIYNIIPSLTEGKHKGKHKNKNKGSARIIIPSVEQKATAKINGYSRYFATCSPGLEPVVAAELASPQIGAVEINEGSGGVYFQGTISTGYRANLWLRSAIRVLEELCHGELSKKDRDCVYDFVRNCVDWPQYLVSSCRMLKSGFKKWRFKTFSVQSRVWNCSQVTNSMSASVRAKDAICDAVRQACNNKRPEPPAEEEGGALADVPLFLSLYRDRATLYRDMSGISLHRRGYRDAMHRASLNEAVAAGILTMAGWNPQVQDGFGLHNKNERNKSMDDVKVLLDPMCGSGTFLIEAALMVANRAPGLKRKHWPFESWHDYDQITWSKCFRSAASSAEAIPKGIKILGNDMHEGAMSLCIRNAEAAGVREALELSCKDCRDYIPSIKPTIVVVNPPWGYRLGNKGNESEDVLSSWQALGQFSKLYCDSADMYVFSGESTLTRELHLKADKKWPVSVGGLDCRLLHYHVLPPKIGTYKGQNMNATELQACTDMIPSVL